MTTAQPKTKERTTVYLPSQLKQTITLRAEEAGQTLSIWVERALNAALHTTAAAKPAERQSSS